MADQTQVPNQEEFENLLRQAPVPFSAKEEPDTAAAKPPVEPAAADPVEAMLSQGPNSLQAGGNRSTAPASSATAPYATAPSDETAKEKERQPASLFAGDGSLAPDDLEFLLGQAQRALASIDAGPARGEPPAGVTPFRFEEFAGAPASTEIATLDLVRDVELDLRIELGRTHMYLEDVLKLRRGSVVPLDKMAGDPVDVFVNGRLVARGEVLVLNDNFCVRVAELVAGSAPAG